jgi:GNAT superfamily N-acetyltransferase
MRVRVLTAENAINAIPRLAEILIDAVAQGAGVSFMHPLSKTDAENYWQSQLADVAAGKTFIFVCEEEKLSAISGAVMLIKAWAPNQPHRADVAKLLVHHDSQRQGAASALMLEVEHKAKELGLTLITFDAVAGGGAEKFYRAMGYTPAGIIPNYAYSRDGQLDDTMFFYKAL